MTDDQVRELGGWIERVSAATSDPLLALPPEAPGGPVEVIAGDGVTVATIPAHLTIYECRSIFAEKWLDRYIDRG